MSKAYTCPVCGYDGMLDPPDNYNICSGCGTEFLNDDELRTHEELRAEWLAGGAKWWSRHVPEPDNWAEIVAQWAIPQ